MYSHFCFQFYPFHILLEFNFMNYTNYDRYCNDNLSPYGYVANLWLVLHIVWLFVINQRRTISWFLQRLRNRKVFNNLRCEFCIIIVLLYCSCSHYSQGFPSIYLWDVIMWHLWLSDVTKFLYNVFKFLRAEVRFKRVAIFKYLQCHTCVKEIYLIFSLLISNVFL